MARPNKNNAEYFSHDNSMRNHRKIKALRQEFGMDGYGAYCMLLETLTESHDFEFKLGKEMEWKMLAGDFGIETERLREIIKAMKELELIQNDSGKISCKNLVARMQPMLKKREYAKQQAQSQPRDESGKYIQGQQNSELPANPVVSVVKTPQRKVQANETNEMKDLLLAGLPADNNNPLLDVINKQTLYEKLGMPKNSHKISYKWQSDASDAIEYLSATEEEISSIHRCFKDNQDAAKKAIIGCRECDKTSVSYFFKVYHDIKKEQLANKP